VGRAFLLAERSQGNGASESPLRPRGGDGGLGSLSYAKRSSADFLAGELEGHVRRAGIAISGPPAVLALDDYRHSARQQTVLFLFDRDSAAPCAVAKVAGQAAQQTVLEYEYNMLQALHERLDRELRATLPQPLALIRAETVTVLLETFRSGRSIYCDLRNHWRPHRCAPEHFRRAREWLVRFHQATTLGQVRLSEEMVSEHIVGPLNTFQRDCDPSTSERELIHQVIALAHQLPNERLPLVARQGDFWARNLMLSGAMVGVVDWEGFRWRSTPFGDLFLFATSYGLSYPWKLGRWAEPAAAFRATYLEVSWLAQLVRDYLLAYCQAMEMSPKLLEIFFPVFLAERALEEREKSEIKTWRILFQTYAHRDGPACFG
jgi:hypothetical protein